MWINRLALRFVVYTRPGFSGDMIAIAAFSAFVVYVVPTVADGVPVGLDARA